MAPIKHVTVIGGGTMGAGIAESAASHGFLVTVAERSAQLVAQSRTNIERHLQQNAWREFRGQPKEHAERFYNEAVARLRYSHSLADAVRSADLVIEAIIEDLGAKHEMFAHIDKFAPVHCIFTSNTSSLSVNAIGQPLSAVRRQQFTGLHFFSPVCMSKLVEIIPIHETREETCAALEQFVDALQKKSLRCKDTPGFVVNALLGPYVAGGIRLVEEGVASASDVDAAMRLALFHPLGPLQIADRIGLDVCKLITDNFRDHEPENRLYRSKLLAQMVERGDLGNKSGRGFYEHATAAKSKL